MADVTCWMMDDGWWMMDDGWWMIDDVPPPLRHQSWVVPMSMAEGHRLSAQQQGFHSYLFSGHCTLGVPEYWRAAIYRGRYAASQAALGVLKISRSAIYQGWYTAYWTPLLRANERPKNNYIPWRTDTQMDMTTLWLNQRGALHTVADKMVHDLAFNSIFEGKQKLNTKMSCNCLTLFSLLTIMAMVTFICPKELKKP